MVTKRKLPGSNLARKNLSFLIIQWKHLTQLGQGNRTQRPYMGFNTVGTGKPEGKPDPKTIYGIATQLAGKPDPEIIMGKDHIWAKTIYGIQHSGTGKSDPKDDRIQHSWQENQTQRPYMGKDHIWDSTQWDRKIRPKRR